MGPDYAARIAKINRALGIPADYAETRHLPVQREAETLVSIGRNHHGRLVKLAPPAAAAWRRMKAAAAADGIELLAISGYRSVARQTKIIRAKLAAGGRISGILRLVAAPGFSEHHTGRALDIGSADDRELDERFARTTAYRWLNKHAARHGFSLSFPRHNLHRISYEPWHWCWHPPRRPDDSKRPRHQPGASN